MSPMKTIQLDEQSWLFACSRELTITSPCLIGHGIIRLSVHDQDDFVHVAEKSKNSIAFFIPASGMGSRMFEPLIKSLQKGDLGHPAMQKWIQNFSNFPFQTLLPEELKKDAIGSLKFLLYEKEGGWLTISKGSIPFHAYDNQLIFSPFEEHVIQSDSLGSNPIHFHFTVQENHREKVSQKLNVFARSNQLNGKLSFSIQSKSTDAFVFSVDGTPLTDENGWIRRPSGHGALLENLNSLEQDIVLIRNIDNIPHQQYASEVNRWWKILIGCLLEIRGKITSAIQTPSMDALKDLKQRFDLYSQDEIDSCTSTNEMVKLLQRPLRVCGMVKNQGQPGGGPFWVKGPRGISKQIVEGAQLTTLPNCKELLNESTHFNPVMIATMKTDITGKKNNLAEFMDEQGGMKITRQHQGQDIVFRERPGLWNEAMADWNTVFIEIPEATFSPVKTVFDLLSPRHQGA
jgi:hypothetical protein